MKLFLIAVACLSVCYGLPTEIKPNPAIAIVKYDNEGVNADGSYQWSLETANGIKAEEHGVIKPGQKENEGILEVSGQSQYTDKDGNLIHLVYIANENGFQPQGNHLPTPPPIPPYIQRSLEIIAAQPQSKEPVQY